MLFGLLFVAGDPSRLWIFFVVLAVNGGASTLFYPARAGSPARACFTKIFGRGERPT